MNQIDVTDAGPIEGTFSVDLSPGPGVYEFRGARGTGKTTCISSIDWLAGHKMDVTIHDGAASGKIEGFGVVAPVGGRKRRRGQMELDTIDAEKFSLSDLVDPPGKTPEVRDAHAIKALAVLSEVEADQALYYELTGGEEAYDELGISETDDPVLLATRIKRALDELARQKEGFAASKADEAVALEHVPDGLDMNAESDLVILGKARDEARDTLMAKQNGRDNGKKAEREAAQAKERLDKLQSEYNGQTIEQAMAKLDDAVIAEKAALATVDQLESQLQKAKDDAYEAQHVLTVAKERRDTAMQHTEAVAALQETASSARAYCSEQEVVEAEKAVDAATEAYDHGILVRDVKRNQAKAKEHRRAQKAAEDGAKEMRNKAGQVFEILAQSLHTSHLTIKSVDGKPRLFVEHPTRGRTVFDRVNGLSDGERVDYCLRELLPHIKSPGLLPIPQRVWQDLQPEDRKRLHNLAVEKNLYLFGAQVDDGALRVKFLGNTD